MSKENILGRTIGKYLRNNLVKGLAIGIGAAILVGTAVGLGVYYGVIYTPEVPGPEPGPEPEPELPFSSRLAAEVQENIPNVVHLEVIGNGTASIHERLIWGIVDRIGDNITYSWNVTAYTIFPSGTVNFVLSQSDIDQIAGGLFDSLNNTERVGTYGEDPYPAVDYLADLKWVTELFLENSTVILLYINLDGLICHKSTTWYGDYDYDENLIGADVLVPESAFDDYVQVLQDLFSPHLNL